MSSVKFQGIHKAEIISLPQFQLLHSSLRCTARNIDALVQIWNTCMRSYDSCMPVLLQCCELLLNIGFSQNFHFLSRTPSLSDNWSSAPIQYPRFLACHVLPRMWATKRVNCSAMWILNIVKWDCIHNAQASEINIPCIIDDPNCPIVKKHECIRCIDPRCSIS